MRSSILPLLPAGLIAHLHAAESHGTEKILAFRRDVRPLPLEKVYHAIVAGQVVQLVVSAYRRQYR